MVILEPSEARSFSLAFVRPRAYSRLMTNTAKLFTGDFEFVAFRSQLDCGAVPEYPIGEQVTLAQMAMSHHHEGATWAAAGQAYYLEKIKSRYCRDGATEREILSRVGARLAKLAQEAF